MFDLQAVALAVGRDAHLLVQARPRRVEPRLRAQRLDHGVPHRLASPRSRRSHHRLPEDQHLSREHGAVPAGQAEDDAGRRTAPCSTTRWSSTVRRHGQLEPAQSQALPAVLRRPRRRGAQGQRARAAAPMARRWPTRCSRSCTRSASRSTASATATATLDLNRVGGPSLEAGMRTAHPCHLGSGHRTALRSASPPARSSPLDWSTPPRPATSPPCGRCSRTATDVNAAQGDGMTALHWAAHEGRRELVADVALRRRQRPRDDAARRLYRACTWPARPATRKWSRRCWPPARTRISPTTTGATATDAGGAGRAAQRPRRA